MGRSGEDRPLSGLIALVLAICVGVALSASIIIISLNPVKEDTQLEAVITTIAGAAVGAIGTYLGTTVHSRTAAQQPPQADRDAGGGAQGEAGEGDEPEVPHT